MKKRELVEKIPSQESADEAAWEYPKLEFHELHEGLDCFHGICWSTFPGVLRWRTLAQFAKHDSFFCCLPGMNRGLNRVPPHWSWACRKPPVVCGNWGKGPRLSGEAKMRFAVVCSTFGVLFCCFWCWFLFPRWLFLIWWWTRRSMAMQVMIKVRKFVGHLILDAARVVGKPSGELGGVELSWAGSNVPGNFAENCVGEFPAVDYHRWNGWMNEMIWLNCSWTPFDEKASGSTLTMRTDCYESSFMNTGCVAMKIHLTPGVHRSSWKIICEDLRVVPDQRFSHMHIIVLGNEIYVPTTQACCVELVVADMSLKHKARLCLALPS